MGEDMQQIANYRSYAVWVFGIVNSITFLTIIFYAIFRFYIYSCYHQFEALTIATLKNGTTFPISSHNLASMLHACRNTFDGTGIGEGETYCRPTQETIF